MRQHFLVGLSVCALLWLGACSSRSGKLQFGFVTNNTGNFWRIASQGVNKAAAECDCETVVLMPQVQDAGIQKGMLQDLLARGVDGIAISPADPPNQTGYLDEVAARTLLITHDSDAPASKRLCFVGMQNYAAGRLLGQLVKEAMPEGGTLVMIVGSLDADNARGRRQGLLDVLLDRPANPAGNDPQNAELKNAKYQVLATFLDGGEQPKAKAAAQDALTRWPDLGCLVGLYEYDPPMILEAVRSANRLGRVRMVAFDENEITLQGVADGHIHATVVQDPYQYGYQSIQLLAKLARARDPAARKALLPPGGVLDVPARVLQQADIAAFRADLKRKLGG